MCSQASQLFKLCSPLACHSARSHYSWRLGLALASGPLPTLTNELALLIFGSLDDHLVDLTGALCSVFTSSIPSCQVRPLPPTGLRTGGGPLTHSPAGQLTLQVD